tara:strand:+ start:758 stop:1234 length:477 start_codon:yes stop_codon:yes gene_type:complete
MQEQDPFELLCGAVILLPLVYIFLYVLLNSIFNQDWKSGKNQRDKILPPIPPPSSLPPMPPHQLEKEGGTIEDSGWWNEQAEKNESIELSSISKYKDKTEFSVKKNSNEENSIYSLVKGFIVLIILFIFAQILDSLGLPIWELLAIIFFLLEILEIFL